MTGIPGYHPRATDTEWPLWASYDNGRGTR